MRIFANNYIFHFCYLVLFIAIDYGTKYWAKVSVSLGEQVEVTSFFNIVHVWNSGVSFGLLQADSRFMILVLVFVALAIVLWLIKYYIDNQSWNQRFYIITIIAGAIGNILDRVINRAVFDFLDFHYDGYHWPAFNFADCCVVMGVIMLLVSGFFAKK